MRPMTTDEPQDDADLFIYEIIKPFNHRFTSPEFHNDGIFDAFINDGAWDRDILNVELYEDEVHASITHRSARPWEMTLDFSCSIADPKCIEKAQAKLKEWLCP